MIVVLLQVLALAVLYLLAGSAQMAVSAMGGNLWADLLIPLAVTIAVTVGAGRAALAGFVAGVLHGALQGMHMTLNTIVLTTICFAVSYLARLQIETSRTSVGLFAAGACLVFRFLFLLLTSPTSPGYFVLGSFVAAGLCFVIAAVLYPLVCFVLQPKAD